MRKTVKALMLAGTVLAVSAVNASAAITAGYAAIGTSIQSEISSGLAVFLPIGGVVLAIGLAWKIGKRFLKG
jgi:hypothetical protein